MDNNHCNAEACSRFTLRDLPLPAKLVVTVFLMSVGLGYCWAMMQLHFKHASAGNLLPGVTDVVERFSGQRAPWEKVEAPENGDAGKDKAANVNAPAPKETKVVDAAKIKSIINTRCAGCHGEGGDQSEKSLEKWSDIAKYLQPSPQKSELHKVLAKENEDTPFGKESMVQAFTHKSTVKLAKDDEIDWKEMLKKYKEKEPQLRAERETERLILVEWLQSGAPEEAYEKDAFPLSEELRKRKLSAEFGGVKAPELPKPEKGDKVVQKKKRNPKDRQLSVEALTQSTHAHLLTFSILWAATGLVFAFTSYCIKLRCLIAPIVLVAQIADISCWWLARMPGVGPYFAVAIMGTGAVVGLGLGAQIVLSLFNMYGRKGKVVLLLLFLIGGAGGGLVFTKYIAPQIESEKVA